MGTLEDGHSIRLEPAASRSVAIFEAHSCEGPTQANFRLQLGGDVMTPWNKECGEVVVVAYNANEDYSKADRESILAAFFTYVQHLNGNVYKMRVLHAQDEEQYNAVRKAMLDKKSLYKRQLDVSDIENFLTGNLTK